MHNLFSVYFVNLVALVGLFQSKEDDSHLKLFQSNHDNSHLKRIISTNCCIHTVVAPDDGLRYARNM
jgi:hypothetical protein